MINLSKKATNRFKFKWTDLQENRGDCWKIDIIMVSRFPVLLIIHEYTLFTLVRNKVDFKKIENIKEEIQECCPWYIYNGKYVIGKNTDKKLNGSINEMKRCTAGNYSSNYTYEIENRINDCLFSALSVDKYGYGKPIEAVEMYKNGEWPIKVN